MLFWRAVAFPDVRYSDGSRPGWFESTIILSAASMSTTLTGQEVAEQLRRAIRGEVSLLLASDQHETWDEAFASNVVFDVGGWRIEIFNDCDSIDYCDSATAPDGRKGDFDDWKSIFDDDGDISRSGTEPIRYIIAHNDEEFAALERLFKAARRS